MLEQLLPPSGAQADVGRCDPTSADCVYRRAIWIGEPRVFHSYFRERARGGPMLGQTAWHPRTSPASKARRSASRLCRRKRNRGRLRRQEECYAPKDANTCPYSAQGPRLLASTL